MGLVAVGAIVFSLLLLIIAAMVWQEVRNTPEAHPVYVIEEAVPFVMGRLGDAALSRLDSDDVLRMLEWEVFYLQGLAPGSEGPVAGSTEAVDFIVGNSDSRYLAEDVTEVLEAEAAYLADIGAIGAPVEPVPE